MHFAQRATTRLADRLVAELALAPAEAERVCATLAVAADRITAVRDRFSRETWAEVRAALVEIAVTLPPGMRAEFRRIVAERLAKLGLPAPALDPADSPTAPPNP